MDELVPRRRVLIADDEPLIRALVHAALSGGSYEVSAVVDGPSALDAIRRERPDVALVDVRMPGMDGLAVCRAVRADRACDAVKVVILTATADLAGATNAGADAFMAKPFRPSELRSIVEQLTTAADAAAAA